MEKEQIILQTKKWIRDVVVACNFCPFAGNPFRKEQIHYHVEPAADPESCMMAFAEACKQLDRDDSIETTLIILPNAVPVFDDYLDLVDVAEKLLISQGYEGIYQVASFHPDYIFAGTSANDAANFTNRSVYPMLHILREDSVEQALDKFPGADQIPDRNITFARQKGYQFMKDLKDSCSNEPLH